MILCAALAAACKQESGADPAETETSGPAKGSVGGFSAALSAEMGGSGSAGSEAAGSGLARTASGNAPTPDSAKTEAAAGGGSGSSAAMKTEPGKTEPGKAEPAKTEAAAGSASGAAAKTEPAKAGSGSGSAVAAKPLPAAGSGTGSAVAQVITPAKPVSVMTPELRAIKLSLEPNWDRDVVEPGTISLFEKNSNATFKFHYGYEDPRAPADRDAYRKYLADNKILTARIDRQSGAAWYLEGADGSGRGVFRIVVTYGGKRLICYGSTYKESPLGDLRDSVLVQAKKICETIQL